VDSPSPISNDDVSPAAAMVPGKFLAQPISDKDRANWRQFIGGRWRWSDALKDLCTFYQV
jgi:hypothetical protein